MTDSVLRQRENHISQDFLTSHHQRRSHRRSPGFCFRKKQKQKLRRGRPSTRAIVHQNAAGIADTNHYLIHAITSAVSDSNANPQLTFLTSFTVTWPASSTDTANSPSSSSPPSPSSPTTSPSSSKHSKPDRQMMRPPPNDKPLDRQQSPALTLSISVILCVQHGSTRLHARTHVILNFDCNLH